MIAVRSIIYCNFLFSDYELGLISMEWKVIVSNAESYAASDEVFFLI